MGGLGSDVARRESGAAGGEHERRAGGQFQDRGGDRLRLVGHDPPLHVEPIGVQQLCEGVAAAILTGAVVHAVGDGQHRCSHAGSFTFETSVMPVIDIPLSTAFAMS